MTLLKWQEPRAFTRAVHRMAARSNWWSRPLLSVLGGLVFIGLWAIAKLNPAKTPPPFWVVCILSTSWGFFMVYIVPWVYSFIPACVKFKQKAIIRIYGGSARSIPPNNILSYEFDEMHGYVVIRFKVLNQNDLVCAIPSGFDLSNIERVLGELKIPK
jgi:hypothetical protein